MDPNVPPHAHRYAIHKWGMNVLAWRRIVMMRQKCPGMAWHVSYPAGHLIRGEGQV